MKKTFLILAASSMMYACSTTPKESDNPLLSEFTTEFGAPPFDLIKAEHFKPAFEQGFQEQNELIDAIVSNQEPATFENVIVALDNSSPILDRVGGVFYNLTSAETNKELQAISKEISPIATGHADNISLNEALFNKIKEVYNQKDQLNLTTEQMRLLEKTYSGFVRSGANLTPEQKERLKVINKELANNALNFSNNLLGEDNSFKLYIDKQEDLIGLPQSFIDGAAEAAKAEGQEGKWLVTLHNSSRLPFLQYSGNRALREQLFTAYINRGNNANEFNNKKTYY